MASTVAISTRFSVPYGSPATCVSSRSDRPRTSARASALRRSRRSPASDRGLPNMPAIVP